MHSTRPTHAEVSHAEKHAIQKEEWELRINSDPCHGS